MRSDRYSVGRVRHDVPIGGDRPLRIVNPEKESRPALSVAIDVK